MKKGMLNVFQILKDGTSFGSGRENLPTKRNKHKGKKDNNDQPIVGLDTKVEFFDECDEPLSADENENIEQPPAEETKTLDEEEAQRLKKINKKREKLALFHKKYGMKVEGDLVPNPLVSFKKAIEKYKISKRIIRNLIKCNYKRPTAIQMIAMPCIFEKRNIMAIAPTGTGKTVAYVIPLLTQLKTHQKGGCRAIVFAPTYELACQLYREFIYLNGGRSSQLVIKLISKVKDFQSEIHACDILVTTPLKFLHGVLQKEDTSVLSALQFVVLDEADKYFEYGFVDQVSQVLDRFKELTNLVYLMFSATIQEPIEALFRSYLFDPIKIIIGGRNHVVSHIDQKLVYVTSEYGKLLEVKKLINEGSFTPNILIFVQSKDRALQLYDEMKGFDVIRVGVIHSGLSKEQRDDIIQKYREGQLWTLICTDLMARGVDFKNVNLVINYDFPKSTVDYIHRVGRTGRANRNGRAITFYTEADRVYLRGIAHVLRQSGCEVPDWMMNLKKVTRAQKKRIKMFPVKRDPISTSIRRNKDQKFYTEMKIRDKIYKKQRLMAVEGDDEGEEQIVNELNDQE